MENLKCFICDEQINKKTMICEYCGTQYKRERVANKDTFLVEHFENPVETVKASMTMQTSDFNEMDIEAANKIAIEVLAQRLAAGLYPFIQVKSKNMPKTETQRFDAQIKVIKPVVGKEKRK